MCKTMDNKNEANAAVVVRDRTRSRSTTLLQQEVIEQQRSHKPYGGRQDLTQESSAECCYTTSIAWPCWNVPRWKESALD
jgi:hypothetical protein